MIVTPTERLRTPALFPQGEQLPKVSRFWHLTRDGDPYVLAMYQRHYSAKTQSPKIAQFVGPGRKLVLLTCDGKACFVWRLGINDIQPPQTGWLCTLFRNEGDLKSSDLIVDAVKVLHEREGQVRVWTLVNAKKVRSINPGCCFKKAGWKNVGTSKTGKMIFAKEGE
jgi:hypothetical protein